LLWCPSRRSHGGTCCACRQGRGERGYRLAHHVPVRRASLGAARPEHHSPGQADQGQPARGPLKHKPGDTGLYVQLLMNRILLVEDHERFARLVSNGLGAAGIAVDAVQRIDAAWSALRQIPYGALVLDRGLPDGDGMMLLKRMRDSELSIPCLILTAR